MIPGVIPFEVNIRDLRASYVCDARCESVGESPAYEIHPETVLNFATTPLDYDLQHASEMVRVGRAMYQDLLSIPSRLLLQQARQVAQNKSAVLRILIKADINSPTTEIPWELLHDGYRALALDPGVTLTRYAVQPSVIRPVRVARPVRVLLTTASPSSASPLDTKAEERLVHRALRPLEERGLVRLEVKSGIRFEALQQALLFGEEADTPFHIWHHCGHGTYTEDNGQTLLVLEGQSIEMGRLTPILRECRHLRLAILNFCYSGVFRGLGQAVSGMNVPAVIAIRDKISDPVALDFMRTLYGQLLNAPIDFALSTARRFLFDPMRPMEWLLPLLHLRTTDASILR